MKKFLLSVFSLLVTIGAFAQDDATARTATDELVEIYSLDSDQAEQMLVIQQRKVRNLTQIETMKNSDIKKYRHKVRAIQQSTDASTRRMLNKEQMVTYQQKRLEWRKDRTNRIAELKESGMTMEQIEDKLLDEGF